MARTRLQYTLFNTPVISSFLRLVALLIMKITGWKQDGVLPDFKKFVVIVAPHTSNWDLFYGIVIAFAFRVDVYYMAKHQLFRFPFAHIMRWLGGIKTDRSHAGNMVDQTIEQFKKRDQLIIALGPEGTRSRAKGWKSGFYYIALGAGVPIQLAFLDYARKAGGLGPLLHPTGDIEADMGEIRKFFSTVTGRYPDKATEIRIDKG